MSVTYSLKSFVFIPLVNFSLFIFLFIVVIIVVFVVVAVVFVVAPLLFIIIIIYCWSITKFLLTKFYQSYACGKCGTNIIIASSINRSKTRIRAREFVCLVYCILHSITGKKKKNLLKREKNKFPRIDLTNHNIMCVIKEILLYCIFFRWKCALHSITSNSYSIYVQHVCVKEWVSMYPRVLLFFYSFLSFHFFCWTVLLLNTHTSIDLILFQTPITCFFCSSNQIKSNEIILIFTQTYIKIYIY